MKNKKHIDKLIDYYYIVFPLIFLSLLTWLMVYAISNFYENPIVISVFIIIGLFLIIKLTEFEQLILFEDSIIFVRKRFYFFTIKKEIFELDTIKKVDLEINYKFYHVILKYIIPGARMLEPSKLILRKKNGESKEFELKIIDISLKRFKSKVDLLID